jgi:DUF4097 and DUF4098 domain-containing protein YvlB
MKFREVLLVIVLLVAGVIVYEVQTGNWTTWGWTFDEDGEFFGFGKAYAFEETQTIQGPLPAGLEVVNSHGWVEVRGSDQEIVQLTLQKKIWRRDEADARAVADKLHIKADRSADRLSFSTNRDDFTKRNFETGFILVVPRRMTVTVTNSYGAVKVEDVREATVRNRHGKVSADNIAGPCRLEGSYEDIEASNLKGGCQVIGSHAAVNVLTAAGDLRVETSYADIRFEDIGGKADIEGSHATVDGRRVKGPVTVETSYEKISLADVGAALVRAQHCAVETTDVRGDLDVQTTYEPVQARNIQGSFRTSGNNVEVSASGIKGPEIAVTTSHENVELADFSANVRISIRHGNVSLSPTDLKFPVDVRGEYSNIDFYWPAGETAPLEAQTRGGNVKWGLSQRPALEKTNGTSLVKAFVENRDKPGVNLSTTYGDIRIEEKGRKI